MMTIKEIRDDYVRYSTNVSNLCRNLSFAGFGIIWIFKYEGSTTIPQCLNLPLLLFIIALAFDLLQYVIQTIIWYRYYLKNKPKPTEHTTEEDKHVNEPEGRNAVTWTFWGLKLFTVILAYCILGVYVFSNITNK